MTEPTTFKITWGDDEKIVEGRQEAIKFAKEKSAEVPMNVNVDSVDDGKSSTISMTYNSGSLEVFVAETRGSERRPRKRERSEEEAAEASSTENSGEELEASDASDEEVAAAAE